MRIVEKGRIYMLKNFSGSNYQELRFNRRRYDGTYSEGTTVEEVLYMLRDKFYHFQSIAPSEYNLRCIARFDECLTDCYARLNEKKENLKDKE
jgi:hypothetical protein